MRKILFIITFFLCGLIKINAQPTFVAAAEFNIENGLLSNLLIKVDKENHM